MRSLLGVLALAALVGCGGGGNGVPDTTPPADTPEPVDLANADDAGATGEDAGPDPSADPGGTPDPGPDSATFDVGDNADDAAPDAAEYDDTAGDAAGPDAADPDTPAPADDGTVDDGAADVPAWTTPYALLSLNLHCLKVDGTTFATNGERFAAIADLVAAQDVAAIAIQEACRTQTTDALALLEAALETATGTPWSSYWVEAHVGWEGTPDEATEGVAVAVRGALSDARELVFTQQGALRRVAASAVLPPELGSLRLVSVHLDYETASVRLAQARQAASWVVTIADPSSGVLVAGDFNDREGQPPHQALLDYGFSDLTDPLDAARIDHVFAHRGAPLQATDVATVFDGTTGPIVSDHHGVLVRVAPGTGEDVVRTRVVAHADVGWGNWLAVRGSVAPLSWQAGWPAVPQGASLWKLVLTGIPAGTAFALKCLRNDVDFQQGADVAATGGATIDVSPAF